MAEVRIGKWKKVVPDETPLLLLKRKDPSCPLPISCSSGFCGLCAVKVVEGELGEATSLEKKTVTRVWGDEQLRLACLCKARGRVILEPLYQLPSE